MDAKFQGSKKINKTVVKTLKKNISLDNADLEVEAGTTGLMGGERDSGSRAFLELTVPYGDFLILPKENEYGWVEGVTICCCGDDAVESLMQALIFSMEVYLDQINAKNQ